MILILDVECIDINTGEVERMTKALSQASGLEIDSPEVEAKALALYKQMRREESERFNDRSSVEQLDQQVQNALSVVARRVAKNLPWSVRQTVDRRHQKTH